jgi:hypothetical protein
VVLLALGRVWGRIATGFALDHREPVGCHLWSPLISGDGVDGPLAASMCQNAGC